MKRIYSTILILAVAFCMAPGVYAQYQHTYEGIGDLYFPHENHNDYGSNDDIGLSKNISSPVDGKYWIKLEAYAKGSGIQTVSSTPSDIILVLDVSSSMSTNYSYTDKDGVLHSGPRLQALKESAYDFVTEIYENDQKSRAADTGFQGNRIAIVTYGGGEKPVSIDKGWTYVNADITKSGDSYEGSLLTTINALGYKNGTRTDTALQYAYELLDGTSGTARSFANVTVLVFTDGCPSTSGSTNFTNSYANKAVYYAHQIKTGNFGQSTKVYSIGLITESTEDYYYKVIHFLQYISSKYPNASIAEDSTTAWTVNDDKTISCGVTNVSSYDADTNGNYYQLVTANTNLSDIFDEISHNAGSSTNTSLTEATSTVDIVSSSFELSGSHSASDIKIYTAPYLLDATTKELYFGDEVLAPCSGGDGPNVGDRYIKKAWTDANGVEHPDTELDVDDAIAIDEDQLLNNIIEVTGFDYSNNWCGPITNNTGTIGAQGHKLIILIPIEMSEDAVGGPNVTTNAAGSGIWVNKETDTEPLVSFTSPTVSLPVNLSLRKEIFVSENAETKVITSEPLPSGENVKFIIMRGVITEERPDDADETWHPDYSQITSWEYVTSVFFPNRNGNDEVKIKGLPSTSDDGDYVYRIIEEDWGWTYTFYAANGQGYVKDDDDNISIDRVSIYNKKGVYSDQFVVNPILFINKNENIDQRAIRHAESKVTNTFLESLGDDKVKQENSR